MKLLVHPDNEIWAEALLYAVASVPPFVRIPYTGVVASAFVPAQGPTGRYVLSDGKVVARKNDDWEWKRGFISYGPEDLDYLIYAGVAKEQIGPVVWLWDDEKFAVVPPPEPEPVYRKMDFPFKFDSADFVVVDELESQPTSIFSEKMRELMRDRHRRDMERLNSTMMQGSFGIKHGSA